MRVGFPARAPPQNKTVKYQQKWRAKRLKTTGAQGYFPRSLVELCVLLGSKTATKSSLLRFPKVINKKGLKLESTVPHMFKLQKSKLGFGCISAPWFSMVSSRFVGSGGSFVIAQVAAIPRAPWGRGLAILRLAGPWVARGCARHVSCRVCPRPVQADCLYLLSCWTRPYLLLCLTRPYMLLC